MYVNIYAHREQILSLKPVVNIARAAAASPLGSELVDRALSKIRDILKTDRYITFSNK